MNEERLRKYHHPSFKYFIWCRRTREMAVLETAIIEQSTIVAIIDNHKVVFLSDMIMTLQQSLARTTITVQHSAKLIFAKFKQQAINIITIM